VLLLPVSLFVVIVISFLLVALIPQSTAGQIAGQGATPARVAAVRHQLGLDRSLLSQFWTYLKDLAHGNLGTSFLTNTPVRPDMFHHVPATLELVIPAFVLSLLLGIGSGTLAAYFGRRLPDRFVAVTTTVVQSLPEFVLALLLIYAVTYRIQFLPAPVGRLSLSVVPPPHHTGFYTVDALVAGQWGTFVNAFEHLVLPVLTLGAVLAVVFTRITRAAMGDALSGPHIEFARALGLPERQVLRYALVESRTPLLTYAAINAATLVGGSAIIELIFSWQGLGQWGLTALTQLDPPQIRGYVLLTATVTLIAFFALDLLSARLDPRIALTEEVA
jgi:ABC-type dipeptide/oligopeptide/nickel transport system permease component